MYQIGTAQLRLNHTELAVYTNRVRNRASDEQIDTLLYYSEGWFSAVYLNLRMFSEHGVLPDPNSDISSIFTAAMIDPLPEKQREFLAVMGLADEFTVEMAQFVMADAHAEDLLAALTGQNAFVKRLPDGATYRFHHMMKECALHTFLSMPKERQTVYRGRLGIWYEDHRLYLHAMTEYRQTAITMRCCARCRRMQAFCFPRCTQRQCWQHWTNARQLCSKAIRWRFWCLCGVCSTGAISRKCWS